MTLEHRIRVAHTKRADLQPGEHEVYSGRTGAQQAPNPLGNPFPVTGKGRWTRQTDEACKLLLTAFEGAAYEAMRAELLLARSLGGFPQGRAVEIYGGYLDVCLRDARHPLTIAVNALAQRLARGEHLVLTCWCAPLRCHADKLRERIIRRAVKLGR